MISGYNGIFRTDDEARAVYAESAGIAQILPRGVVVPASVEDVCAIVRWARETGTSLIPRGSGSSMGGGAVGDGVIVDLSRLREIGDIDVARRRVRVGPGALRGDVDTAARRVGLHFPPDPSSGKFCTIGGMISTNAAGAHTLKYGSTRPWITALDCVFDDGSRATIERGMPVPPQIPALDRFREITDTLRTRGAMVYHAGVRKDSSGYALHDYAEHGDLVDLLVGSEGTLVMIVGAELRLMHAPSATSSLLGAFATLEEAVTAATRARDAGAVACELLDRTFLEVAVQGSPLPSIPAESEAVLLAEVEGDDPTDVAHRAETLARDFTGAGATAITLALTLDTEEELWELRHAVSPMLTALGPSRTSMQFIEDSAVPPACLPEYVRGIRRILRHYDVPGVIFGHAGDAHVHVNPLIDIGSPHWQSVVRHIFDDVVALTARLGGTLTGEHGDGRLRTPVLPAVWSAEALTLFQTVKQTFDPSGLFNPGVKVAQPGQQSISKIKYDPALPPLPPRAAAALAYVAKERAYDRFRLDLLDHPS